MDGVDLLIGTAVLALGTFAFRFAGPVLRSRVKLSPRAERLMALAAVVLLAAFAVVEARSANPLVPGRLAGSPRFLSALAVAFALTFATTPASVVGTAFFQAGQGLSPGVTGVLFAPFSLGVVAGSAVGARVLDRTGARVSATAGLGVVVVALAAATPAVSTSSTVLFAVSLAVSGCGLGAASVAATHAGTEVVADGDRGIASGLLNTAPQLGSAIGTAVIGAVARGPSPPHLATGLVVAASVALAGVLAATGLRAGVSSAVR
ncbi:MFS transporter [Amycolatopsis solani]|uniref:MFS transporter n=1 Tax=Amycolatopsis solani TaxID=3028615 RepID=UPI0025B08BA6|nr:MFS transporter [Amycolatopsis sp. MEP2-6]